MIEGYRSLEGEKRKRKHIQTKRELRLRTVGFRIRICGLDLELRVWNLGGNPVRARGGGRTDLEKKEKERREKLLEVNLRPRAGLSQNGIVGNDGRPQKLYCV